MPIYRPLQSLCVRFTSVFLSYLLLVSLAFPLVVKTVNASPGAAASNVSARTRAAEAPTREGELIVRFREGVTEEDKDAVVGGKGARRDKKMRGQSRIEKLTIGRGRNAQAAAAELRLLPEVELAEPNYLISRSQASVNDERFAEQWALDNQGQTGGMTGSDVRARGAWDATTGSPLTVVAVLDSGIDFSHPDLAENQWTNTKEKEDGRDNDHDGFADDLHGWDWVTQSGAVRDEQGHGTAVAGLIASQGNNGVGIAGVMWRAALMNLRVLDNTGTGDVAAAVEAIDYAAAHGAQVINCSWGTEGESVALKDAIARAGARGVVVVASAGNDARDIDATPFYPASYDLPNLISVASTDQFDQLAQFSDWGASSVALAAPGVEVLTTKMGGGYWTVSGTSASAPLVAGVAGLVKTQRPWLNAEGTKKAVIDGARRIDWLQGRLSSGGVVNAARALESAATLGSGYVMPPNTGNRGGHSGDNNGNNGNNENGNGNGNENNNGNGNGNGNGGATPRPGKPGHGGRSESEFKRTPTEKTSGAMPNLPNLNEIANKPSYVPQSAPASIRANLAPICDSCYEGGGSDPIDPEFSTTRTQPQNETGQPGVDLGSRNFNWNAGLVGLRGRGGLDVNLALYYNSLVWIKQGSSIQYNADNGFPGPGFNLNFPFIQEPFYDHDTGVYAYMMVTPTGARVKLLQLAGSTVYEANDGSYIQFDAATNVMRTTDGTQFFFTDFANGEKRCHQIKDRNGNVISVGYNTNGRITQVTDTLGRVVSFNYDGDGNLASLSQARNGMANTLVTFGYGNLYMQPNFPGLIVYGPVNQTISVLTRVNFSDGSYYAFEYNPFGQVHTIRHYAADGSQLSYTGYNLPGSHWAGMSGQSDCPRFTERRNWVHWGVMNNDAETVTTYSAAADSSWTQVMTPDRMVYKEYYHTSGWEKGLIYQTEVFHADSPSVVKKRTTATWTQDVTASTNLSIGDAGFENPYVGYGVYQNAPNGGAWVFTNDANGAAGLSGNNSALTNGMSAAPEGAQVAYLYGRTGATISQTIGGFAAGVPYTLSFSAAQRRYSNTGGQDFDVYLDNKLLGTYRPASYFYSNFSVNFITTAGSHTLKFVGRGSSGTMLTALIDNVRISATGTQQANPRVSEANVYDDAGNRRRTTMSYGAYGLPSSITEYAADAATPLRQTNFAYELNEAFVNRRIIGLESAREDFAYSGGTATLVARTTRTYDSTALTNPGSVAGHDDSAYGAGFTLGRANLTEVRRFDKNYPHDMSRSTATTMGYDTAGSQVWTQDASGHRVNVSYADSYSDGVNRNTFAYPTSVTDPDNHASTVQYNFDTGAATRTQDAKGAVKAMQYDTVGRISRTSVILNSTEYSYHRYVYPASMIYVQEFATLTAGAGESRTEQHFDGAGRVRAVSSTFPGSAGGYRAIHHMYDAMGRRVKTSNPTEVNDSWVPVGDDAGGWVWTEQQYDWQGRPTLKTKPDGWTTDTTYGGCGCAGGEQVTTRDERGRRRKLYKDVFGRLVKVEELDWSQAVYATGVYAYNSLDQLTSIRHYQGTSASGSYQERTYGYDGYGRLVSKTTPEQGTTSYTYNNDDTVNTITDARGAVTSYGYNARHLISAINYTPAGGAASTANVSFGYDAAGNRTQMNDGQGSVSYGYDTLSRLTSETRTFSGLGASYTLSYTYNLAGQLANITNPWNAQVGYSYDVAGQSNGVTGANYYGVSTYASGQQYRAHGGLKAVNYGNGRQLSASYDGMLRLRQWNVANVQGYEYGYDNFNEHTGRITSARNLYDATLDRSYDYDHSGRLISSHSGINARAHLSLPGGRWDISDGPYAQDYGYDVWGNMTQRLGWGGEAGTSATTHNNKNQRAGFSYDAAGNLTNDLGQNFVYDVGNHQVSASYGGYSLTQGYDGDGMRVQKNDNGQVVYYLRSTALGGQVVAELNSSGWQRGYVYDAGGQLLAIQNAGVYWVHMDPATKNQRLTDTSGTVTGGIELDPWGGNTSRSWAAGQQPRKFTTYERDGNKSDEAMMRRFNRWHARFDQPDPFDGSYNLTDLQTLNRYAYVQNDPVNLVDPSGLDGVSLMDQPHWTDICFSAAYSGCGSGPQMAAFAIDFGMRQFFGYNYWDLPGYGNELEQGMYRYESLLNTGFDPAFGIYRGSVDIISTNAQGQTTTQTLNNPTPQQVTEGYLKAAGLWQYIKPGSMQSQGTGVTFQFDESKRTEIFKILDNTKIFLSGPFGALHKKDVGASSSKDMKDYRSITGDPNKGYLGPRSLQVVVHRTTLAGYADTDRFNPYQDLVGFFGHTFIELVPNRIKKIFGKIF